MTKNHENTDPTSTDSTSTADADAQDPTRVEVDHFYPHPPSKVWRALTTPELMEKWLMPTTFAPVVGHQFTFTAQPIEATNFSGKIACEVLELVDEELLKISWTDAENPGATDWTVSWTLKPEGAGTRVFLLHDGFDADDEFQQLSRKFMGGGWANHIPRALGDVLEGM
ncbi:hypothetical protein NCCP2495_25140 [Dietzia sp. NCCP-2495]|uniref:SRPBCC family protein n=1 Tax=Dietzia sp. NCCP-2495 TaxID=2934675 RepID=UPI00222EE230|nr:SRPBCC domain-containing protein [Dietzia sp. NCCP-2495]GLB64635.1 hypothetical protein NCCP2495_25140 [Dietzia sp. NCCP-2495]